MEELLTDLFTHSPLVLLMYWWATRFYDDWKAEREQARLDRIALLEQIGSLLRGIEAWENRLEALDSKIYSLFERLK